MSKKRTRHIKMVRSQSGTICGVNLETQRCAYCSSSAEDTFNMLDKDDKSCLSLVGYELRDSIMEWVNRSSDYAKQHYTPIIMG